MSSITLGQILLDGRHSTGLRFGLDEARLAAALNSVGVVAKLYSGKPEGRVVDVVRHLVRARTDRYLFSVTPESASAILQLARGLREMRADALFSFWLHGDECHPEATTLPYLRELESLGPVIAASSAEAMLAGMVQHGIISTGAGLTGAQFSPYLSGLLSREDASEYGLETQQPARELKAELEWLMAQHLAPETVIPLLAEGSDETRLLNVCEMLGDLDPGIVLELRTSAAEITQAVMDAMTKARLNRLRVDDVAALTLKPAEYGVELASAGRDGPTGRLRWMEYGRNGMIAVHSGIYPDANAGAGIQHLEVSVKLAMPERRAGYEWAAPNMLLRSAAVLNGPLDLITEQFEGLRSPQTRETSGWPKHTYAIGKERDGGAEVVFDGDAQTMQPLQYVALRKLDETSARAAQVTFVSMREAEDLANLERRLERFHREGVIRAAGSGPLVFENMCRWLPHGACRLVSLRRLQIEPGGGMRACRDSGEVGNVGQSYDALVTTMKQRKQMEEVRRGCAVCPVREQCSQCVHLPEAWGGRYCEIRIAYPQTPVFMVLTQFPQVMSQFLHIETEGMELLVSYTGLPAQHYRGRLGETRRGERPVIVTVAGQHLAWWAGTPKLVRLSAPLALMEEAWWSGAEERDVIQELSASFNVSAETAASSLAEGLQKLRGQGIIYG